MRVSCQRACQRACQTDRRTGRQLIRRPARQIAVAVALAVSLGAPADTDAKPEQNFWERVLITKDREIADALSHAKDLYQSAQRAVQSEDEETLRRRMLREARGMLAFALRLRPEHREVLERMAMVEEASGRVAQAIGYYEQVYARTNKDPMSGDACVRFGLLLARADQHRRAIEVLQRCMNMHAAGGPLTRALRSSGLINLSNLYAAEGQLEEAIELLERERVGRQTGILAFALVVLCDKDQQINRAFELLQYQRHMDERFVLTLIRELGAMPMVPAEDRHYFTALLLEARGSLPEAREEWHHYIRSRHGARYAERARQHLEAIDALLTKTDRSPRKKK